MNWVTINKFSELSGYSSKAVQVKKDRGIWKEGLHWIKAPDGRILISLRAIDEWIQGIAT